MSVPFEAKVQFSTFSISVTSRLIAASVNPKNEQFRKVKFLVFARPPITADLVNQAEDQIQGAIDDFSALTPPPEAQEAHDQTLAALEDFSSKLSDVSNAAESGDKQALQEAAQALQQAGLDFQSQLTEAAQKYQDAGIDLGGSSTDSTTG